MTQEDKELLIKDLCGRLPYKVKGIIAYNGDKDVFTVKGIFNILFLSDTECCKVEDFKPYLRPMGSMTDEEKEELVSKHIKLVFEDKNYNPETVAVDIDGFEWLNAHHFDYRGLIPKGLALEAPEGMYNS